MKYAVKIGEHSVECPDYLSAQFLWDTFNLLGDMPPHGEAIRPIGALDKPIRLATIKICVKR